MLASLNAILYTKEAVRFIVIKNVLTTVFIDPGSIFCDSTLSSLQFSMLNVSLLSTVSFLGKANHP